MKNRIPSPDELAIFLKQQLDNEYQPGDGHRHDFHIDMDFEGTEENLSIHGTYLLDYTEHYDEEGYSVTEGASGVIIHVATIYSYATGEEIELPKAAIQQAFNDRSLTKNHRRYSIEWLFDRIGERFFAESDMYEDRPEEAYAEIV